MKHDSAAKTVIPGASQTARAAASQAVIDETLARIGRLETVLAATGGTLHDVNNLLTVLGGNLYLLTEAVRDDAALLARCRTARNTAQRAGELIRELLDAARERDDTAAAICPARCVAAMEPLLRRCIGTGHGFRVVCDEDPWYVAASAAQFESAVANLVINANEALTSPGSIEVRVQNKRVRDEKHIGGRLRHFVCVSVIDNGPGIPAHLLEKVSDPLFTSKPRGQGNGMGLAMVKTFARKAGGRLEIRSEEGKGTLVRIQLPRHAGNSDTTANLTMPISTLPAGDETVLLMVSDHDARATIAQLLDALGYTVIQAADRNEARHLARSHANVALLICDRSAEARLEEAQWVAQLRKLASDLRQVALLAPDADANETAGDAEVHLRKPVSVPELAKSLRLALEAGK